MNWKVFLRKTAPRLLAAVLVIALLAVAATSLMKGRAGLITDLEGRLRRPFQQGAETIASWLEGLYGSVYDYDQLKAENETLREQLAEAQAEARAGQEALEENERLRQLLSFSQRHTDYDLESAKVVSYSASNWSALITISKGDESGIEVGDSVITESGSLVGQVIEVGSGWSTVRTIIDVDLNVGGYVSNSGATGMVVGEYTLMQEGHVKLGYLAEGVSLFEGDTVLTSGKGGAFPSGLVIGSVAEVRSDAGGQETYGVIQPACDLANMVQVFIIKDYKIVE